MDQYNTICIHIIFLNLVPVYKFILRYKQEPVVAHLSKRIQIKSHTHNAERDAIALLDSCSEEKSNTDSHSEAKKVSSES